MGSIYKNGNLQNKINNASIPNLEWMIQAGMDPKTGLPRKADIKEGLKGKMKHNLRIQDEQDAVQSFQWFNLPQGISSEELERLLYYKGQLCFFYHEPLDRFFFMPYALDGTLDFYGRFNTVHPIPFFWGNETKEEQAVKETQKAYLSTLKLDVIKDIKLDQIGYEDFKKSCVILRDYTPQRNVNNVVPKAELQEAIIELESVIPCYLRTALMNSTGVLGMRVNGQEAYSNVLAACEAIERAAEEGERLVPIVSAIEFQDLTGGTVAQASEYLEALQAVDNFRLGFHGLDNAGVFQKKSHMLESEQAMNAGKVKSTLQDRLSQRQHFCDIVNSLTGLGIWCEPKEGAIGIDMDMDGAAMDDEPDQVSYEGESEDVQ